MAAPRTGPGRASAAASTSGGDGRTSSTWAPSPARPGRDRVVAPTGLGRAAATVALAASTGLTAAALVRGAQPPATTVLVLLVAAFAAYGLLLATALHHPPPGVAVAAAAAVLLGLAVVTPPLRSGDIRSYSMYGRIVAHHRANPYLHPPSEFRGDPLLARMDERWRDTPSVYGPVFTGLSAATMAFAGTSPVRARVAFQGLAALATAAALALLARRTHAGFVAAVACNPVLVLSVVNGGHNDALVGLAVVGGCLLAAVGRPRWAGAVLAVGALVKIVALLPLAAVAAWVLHRRARSAALALAGTAAVVLVAGYLLAGGMAALDPLRDAGLQTSRASPWDGIRHEVTHALVDEGWRGVDAGREARARLAPLVVVSIVGLATLLAASRLRDATPAPAAAVSLLAYLLAGAYVLPWYAGFVLPVLALARSKRLLALAAAHTGLLLLVYLPWPEPDVEPAQRLMRDLYGVWVPLLVAGSVVALSVSAVGRLVVAGRRPRRRRGRHLRRRRWSPRPGRGPAGVRPPATAGRPDPRDPRPSP